jgi:transcriptional/translational regulatory protein YebC/TACO1
VNISYDFVEVYAERTDFAQVSQALKESGFEPDNAELIMKPNTTLALASEEATDVLNMVEALEELDDVTKVSHNLEITDELVAQFA